jgi:hypothetical protein
MKAGHTITIKPSDKYFGLYGNLFRWQVHSLIDWGYRNARYKIKSNNEEEPNITGYITKAIRDRLIVNNPSWCQYYYIREDSPIEARGRYGRSRPRPDIIIETNFRDRPEYTFEAKRLRKNGFGVNKYIDSDGVGCFVSGLYASRYSEAAMLGYVQSDSLPHWQSKIKKAIAGNAKLLCLKSPQNDETVIETLPFEWVSQHDRHSVGRSIYIYHILLNCIV